MKRLAWLDISKALAICWVVYFHFLRTVFEHYELPPPDWSGIVATTTSILRTVWWEVSGLGFHAVGAFIILSGWTLMQSTMRRAESGKVAWGASYGARFVRLYPMYWVAHLVYLFSPFVARLESVDERIVLSLLGLRFINIEMILSDLPPALPGSTTTRTVDFFSNRIRSRLFRALSHARCVSTTWVLGSWWICYLPVAGIRIGNGARNVALKIDIADGMVSPARHRIRRWFTLVSAGIETL